MSRLRPGFAVSKRLQSPQRVRRNAAGKRMELFIRAHVFSRIDSTECEVFRGQN
jgi:hypothetical protein